MIFKQTTQKGFTLVETLVAVSILLIIIVGPMTISTSTARSTSFASEQVTAFFLAQEGAEIIQKVRDDELLVQDLDPDAWDDIMDEEGPLEHCFGSGGCGVQLNTDSDATLDSVIDCEVSGCLLYYSEAGERAQYNHSSAVAEPTIFSRVITMEKISPDEVHIISTVYWRTVSQRAVQKVAIETYLYDVYGF